MRLMSAAVGVLTLVLFQPASVSVNRLADDAAVTTVAKAATATSGRPMVLAGVILSDG